MRTPALDVVDRRDPVRSGLSRRPVHWLQLIVGLALLAGFIHWVGRDRVPQGPSQELHRHALRAGMDATALFYSEVEEMPYYESIVAPWRQGE